MRAGKGESGTDGGRDSSYNQVIEGRDRKLVQRKHLSSLMFLASYAISVVLESYRAS